jgi:hypothetical protein
MTTTTTAEPLDAQQQDIHADVARALHRIADALELLAVTQIGNAARAGSIEAWEQLVDNMQSAQFRGFFGEHER